eukprot:6174993-Pleurochrysis_carterae.AAC.2
MHGAGASHSERQHKAQAWRVKVHGAGAASNSARRRWGTAHSAGGDARRQERCRSGQRKAPGAENVSKSGQAGGKRGQRKAPAGLRGNSARRRR